MSLDEVRALPEPEKELLRKRGFKIDKLIEEVEYAEKWKAIKTPYHEASFNFSSDNVASSYIQNTIDKGYDIDDRKAQDVAAQIQDNLTHIVPYLGSSKMQKESFRQWLKTSQQNLVPSIISGKSTPWGALFRDILDIFPSIRGAGAKPTDVKELMKYIIGPEGDRVVPNALLEKFTTPGEKIIGLQNIVDGNIEEITDVLTIDKWLSSEEATIKITNIDKILKDITKKIVSNSNKGYLEKKEKNLIMANRNLKNLRTHLSRLRTDIKSMSEMSSNTKELSTKGVQARQVKRNLKVQREIYLETKLSENPNYLDEIGMTREEFLTK